MSDRLELMGAQEEISVIPARELGGDFVNKVLLGVVLEAGLGFLGGARRKGPGLGRQGEQRCMVRKCRAGPGNSLDRKAPLTLTHDRR